MQKYIFFIIVTKCWVYIIFQKLQMHCKTFGKYKKSSPLKISTVKNILQWGRFIKTVLAKVTSDSLNVRSLILISLYLLAAFDAMNSSLLDILSWLGFRNPTRSQFSSCLTEHSSGSPLSLPLLREFQTTGHNLHMGSKNILMGFF